MRAAMFLCFSFIVLVGCTKSINVGITSYLSHENRFPDTAGEKPVAVFVKAHRNQPMLVDELRLKVEFLLSLQGFRVTDSSKARYVVFAFAAMDDGLTETGYRRMREGGGTSFSQVFTSSGNTATVMTQHPRRTTYVPYDYTVYTRFLVLDLLDLERWETLPENAKEKATIWRCESVSRGQESDLRGLLDYLLVPSFEQFGLDTGKQVTKSISENDKNVTAFRESFAAAKLNSAAQQR